MADHSAQLSRRIETMMISPSSETLLLDDILSVDGPAVDRCPACGSRAVMPTLLARGEWECWESPCFAVWTVDQ